MSNCKVITISNQKGGVGVLLGAVVLEIATTAFKKRKDSKAVTA